MVWLAQVEIQVGTPDDPGPFQLSGAMWLAIGLAASVVFLVVMVWLYERFAGRTREAATAAARAGFHFHDVDAKDVGRTRFVVFGDFDRMSISNQMSGRTDRGTPVVAFDFCAQIRMEVSTDQDGTVRRRRLPTDDDHRPHPLVPRSREVEWVSQGSVRSGAVVDIPAWLPHLVVAPEGPAWKAYSRLAGADMDFESEEFNRRYRVRTDDAGFGRRFLGATVLDVLLRSEGDVGLETFGDRILLFGKLQPARRLPDLARLAGMVREQVPELVFHEHPLPSRVAAAEADRFRVDDRSSDHPSGISW